MNIYSTMLNDDEVVILRESDTDQKPFLGDKLNSDYPSTHSATPWLNTPMKKPLYTSKG